jgi:hypothetical protein
MLALMLISEEYNVAWTFLTAQSNSRGALGNTPMSPLTIISHAPTANIFPDQKKKSAVDFLKAAVSYHRGLGITANRIVTDN